MRIVTTSAVALGTALLLSLAAASPSLAKAHSNGVGGNGAAGPMTAGQVDNLVGRDGVLTSDRGNGISNYGAMVSEQAKDGGRGKSEMAQDPNKSVGNNR